MINNRYSNNTIIGAKNESAGECSVSITCLIACSYVFYYAHYN